MKPTLSVVLNVLFAVIATVLVLGPVGVLGWFAWRNLLAGAMLYTAFGLVMIALMAAGQGAWSPGGSPGLLLAIAAVLAAGLCYGAWSIANGSLAMKIVTVPMSIVALGWVLAFWPVLRDSWLNVRDTETVDFLLAHRNREASEAGRQRSADNTARSRVIGDSTRLASGLIGPESHHPPRDGFLIVNDASDVPQRLFFRDGLDIVSVGQSEFDATRQFLNLIEDERLEPYLAGRELVLLTTWRGDEKVERMRNFRVLRLPLNSPVSYAMTPGFLDSASSTFRDGPYRWMKDVLRIPKPERDAIYSKYFGKVPE